MLQCRGYPCCPAVPWTAQRYHGLPSGTMDCPAEPGAAQQRQGPPSNNQGPPSNARGRTATPGAAQQRQGPHSNAWGRTATLGAAHNARATHNARGHSSVSGPIWQHESGKERPPDHIGHRWATSINCGPCVSMWGCPSQHIVVKDCHYLCLLQGG